MKTIKLQLLIWLIPININLYAQDTQSLTLNLSATPNVYTPLGNSFYHSDVIGKTGGKTVYLWIKDNAGNVVNCQDCELTSSNPAVATIDIDGVIVFTGHGVTTLTAVEKSTGAEGILIITIINSYPPHPFLLLSLSSDPVTDIPVSSSVVQGTTVYLHIKHAPGVNVVSPIDCNLISYNPAAATIDADGTVVAVAPGTAVIKAINNSREGILTVTVSDPTNVITPKTDAITVTATTTGVAAQFEGKAAIELYAINGILLDKTQADQTYSRDLDRGVYILRINGRATKFVR